MGGVKRKSGRTTGKLSVPVGQSSIGKSDLSSLERFFAKKEKTTATNAIEEKEPKEDSKPQ